MFVDFELKVESRKLKSSKEKREKKSEKKINLNRFVFTSYEA